MGLLGKSTLPSKNVVMLLRGEEIKNSSIEKRKEKKNEEEYTRLHSYALHMLFFLTWLRHHMILHTLYWIYAPSPLESEDAISQHIFATLP